MSQDLLAEFGSFTVSGDQQSTAIHVQKTVSDPGPNGESSRLHYAQPATSIPQTTEDAWAEDDDDDDFGDFEQPTDIMVDNALAAPSPPKAKSTPKRTTKTTKPTSAALKREPLKTSKPKVPVAPPAATTENKLSKGHPFAGIADVLFNDEYSDEEGMFEVTKSTSAAPRRGPPKTSIPKVPVAPPAATKENKLPKGHPFAGIADVLFDAEYSDEEGMFEVVPVKEPKQKRVHDDEDDFGDFESTATATPEVGQKVEPVRPVTQQSATVDLLGFAEERPQHQSPQIESRTASIASRPAIPKSTPKAVSKIHAHPSTQESEDFAAWDDFESSSPSIASQSTQPTPSHPPVDLTTTKLGELLRAAPTTPSPAPSNIPPPSLLLTLFPPLIKSTSSTLLTPISTLPSAQKSTLLSDTAFHTYLRTYLTLTHILSHILAGRKLRWKRDKFLAQSMRIGPSVSGRSGGMKLAGVDSNESRREEAECEDVLRAWKEQVGRLKSAVVGASAAVSAAGGVGAKRDGWPVVPELALTMPVRVAKQDEGGVVSVVACALCGLKREERVVKVDVDVEDSFGEWWVEGTNMHSACWNFWTAHKASLRGR